MHVDGPRLDTTCPRYFGPALAHAGHARIEIEWTDPARLLVGMDEPGLYWQLSVSAPSCSRR
jgi:hypothetical protein